MITTGASVIISASIWQLGGIVPDIWFDPAATDDVLTLAASISDYYLKQMNFMGNIFEV